MDGGNPDQQKCYPRTYRKLKVNSCLKSRKVLFTHEEKVSFVEDTFPESETPCPP